MSKNFSTPVDFWLGLALPELYESTATVKEAAEEDTVSS
jgi:hypothetical protein